MPLSGPRIATAAETLVKTPSGKVGDISDSAFEQPAVVDFRAFHLHTASRIRLCSAEGFPCTR
jgi:hypothetical protein